MSTKIRRTDAPTHGGEGVKTTYPPVLPRFRSRWASAMQLFAMVCLILQPLTVNSYWSDTNSDNANDTWFGPNGTNTLEDLDLQSTDIDGDNATNAEEAQYNSDPFTFDTDGDGLDDGSEIHLAIQQSAKTYALTAWDSDGDGVSDHDDFYNFFGVIYPGGELYSFPGSTYSDADGDGLKNHEDTYPLDPTNNDGDGDAIDDAIDPALGDATNYSTTNGTSWYSDALGDIDGDYNLNFWDDTPWGQPGDSDNDGYTDDIDPAPNDSSNYSSTNGITWYGAALGDDDTDGTLNFHDTTPYPPGDSDSDGLTDDIDPAPMTAATTAPPTASAGMEQPLVMMTLTARPISMIARPILQVTPTTTASRMTSTPHRMTARTTAPTIQTPGTVMSSVTVTTTAY